MKNILILLTVLLLPLTADGQDKPSFSAREMADVRVTTPGLFAKSNHIYLHLDSLKDHEYAFPLPGGKVISAYGTRGGHSGTDIKTCAKDTIRAAFDGVVRMSKPYYAYGNIVVIRHANGLETLYSHNFKNLVKAGDVVKAGQVFDVNNKMNDEIIFAVRFNKDVEGEGHGYWFSIINLTDDTNQTKSLKECYKDGDKRKNLITYVKVEDKVCVMNKFKDVKSATYNTVGNDQIILRYADVLLMYAEALNEISYSNLQNSEAMVALNAVHTRAGLSPLQITELPDQDSFRKAIMLERQQEFPYEGQRWFDLVRMGGAKEAMKAEGHTIQDYQFLYPIPKTELERINNTELLWQNTGY